MKYPQYVRIKGEKVKINTDTKTALRCLEITEDNSIGDHERALAIVYLMYGDIPLDDELQCLYFEQAVKFLQRGKEVDDIHDDSERDMDLLYDEQYIMASFLSVYNIDITQENMHFWRYCDLIAGFTNDCIMSKVREIRTIDPKEYAEKDRRAIYKAKEQLALPRKLTREEQIMNDEFEALFE